MPTATQDACRKTKPQRGGKRGRKPKQHGMSQHFFNREVLDLVTSRSQPCNCRSSSMGIALPIQHHGGEAREREDTSPPGPTSKSSWREVKRRGIQTSPPEFSSQDQEGGREGGRLGYI